MAKWLDPVERDLEGLTIVVVDDDEAMRSVLKLTLESLGAQVLVAASARDALALVETHEPAVLVSDISMPGEDGYWLIRTIRNLPSPRARLTPAIAITGLPEGKYRQRALECGFQAYARKPFVDEEIVDLVTTLARGEAA